MAIKVAIANLKGGVGKSTATLYLSEALAVHFDQRVLVIDLDPQSNTSFMMLSRQGVEQAEQAGKTLPHFLLDNADGRQHPAGYVWPNASDLDELRKRGKRGKVDIIPSVPRMWFVEMIQEKRYYLENREPAVELKHSLDRYLGPILSFYDVIILDCPPGFSALTRAGLLSADVVISPTIADAVSVRSLADFAEFGLGEILKIRDRVAHFVLVSKYRSTSDDAREAPLLKKRYDVLEPFIKYSVEMTRATERVSATSTRTFGEKYGSFASDVRALADKLYRYVIPK